MKTHTMISVVCLLIFSCSDNHPTEKKPATGADFIKEEKPKVDLTIIDPNAPIIKVTLVAQGNTMADMIFDKDTIRVPANSTIEFMLKNASTDQSMQHNFVLIEKGSIQVVADAGVKAGVEKSFIPAIDEVRVSSKLTKPGETSTIRFATPAKGDYDFVCTYPGHYSRMKGVFIVE